MALVLDIVIIENVASSGALESLKAGSTYRTSD